MIMNNEEPEGPTEAIAQAPQPSPIAQRVKRSSQRAATSNPPKHFKDFEVSMKCSGKRPYKDTEDEVEDDYSESPSIESTPYEDTTSYHYNSDGKEGPSRRGRGSSNLRKDVKGKYDADLTLRAEGQWTKEEVGISNSILSTLLRVPFQFVWGSFLL